MSSLQKFQKALVEAEQSAFLVSDRAGVFWLTGFTGSLGYALVTPMAGRLLVDSRYTLQAAEQCRALETHSFGSPMEWADFLKSQIVEMGISQLFFDENHIPVGTFKRWSEKFEGVELLPATDPISKLRMIKTPAEMSLIRQACRLADACLEHIQPLIRPGLREDELQLEIELFFRRNGAEAAFTPIVVSGERSARPHGTASEKPLETGDFLTLDLGAKLNGYCSDITRTFVIGKASQRHQAVYHQVLKAQCAALEAIRPGTNGKDVDSLARQILDEQNLAQYFGHGLGHGLGALVHDSGRLSQTTDQLIETGQVWTVEPGVYIEGFGGARIEDDIVVTEDGIEVLTHFPKELIVL
jgi:Xaa-Pro aminopeptidase